MNYWIKSEVKKKIKIIVVHITNKEVKLRMRLS